MSVAVSCKAGMTREEMRPQVAWHLKLSDREQEPKKEKWQVMHRGWSGRFFIIGLTCDFNNRIDCLFDLIPDIRRQLNLHFGNIDFESIIQRR